MVEWEVINTPKPKLLDANWVATIVEIRDNATGSIREYPYNAIMKAGSNVPCAETWTDGNWSCDCNRRRFFAWSSGEFDHCESECGKGAYSVRARNKKNNRVFYSEFEATVR